MEAKQKEIKHLDKPTMKFSRKNLVKTQNTSVRNKLMELKNQIPQEKGAIYDPPQGYLT